MNLLQKLSNWYFTKRALPYWCVLALDCAVVLASGFIGTYIEFGCSRLASHWWPVTTGLFICLPVYVVCFILFHTHQGILRFSSYYELFRICKATLLATVIIAVLGKIELTEAIYMPGFKTSAVIFAIATLVMSGIRMAVKASFESFRVEGAIPVAIYGTQAGGIALANSIRSVKEKQYTIQAFITDRNERANIFLFGKKVYLNQEGIAQKMKDLGVHTLLVSPLKTDLFRNNQQMVDDFSNAGIKIMMMPSAEEWDGKSDLSYQQLREVEIEDLLPREKIEVDMEGIGRMLKGKRILITGAAGSIGSEMARQVAKFAPAELVLVDQAETPMHDVRLYMARNYPNLVAPTIVGSIANPTHMEQIFRQHRPEYVFHAAAYKHVPMMEDNPAMAIQNNTYGTRVIADLAVKYGTKKFVMISTDKAVNPTNVMGSSKRICEIYCQALNRKIEEINKNGFSAEGDVFYSSNEANSKSGDNNANNHLGVNSQEGVDIISSKSDSSASQTSCFSGFCLKQADGSAPVTQFVTTRFGNVLGSNGSVIPIFREQIKKGGPVCVTHPDIIRFFMLIPEACQLVLEAGTMGKGGEIFVFDMGKPVRIVDLARRMIKLSGAQNVEIKFTGLRDGEKLYEEVLNDAEQTKPTVHPKIKVASVREYPYAQALANEEELLRLSYTYDDMAIVKKMKEIVPEYKSKVSKYEILDK